jgi:hypothetical protein
MNKKEQLQFDRLTQLLEFERARAEKAWVSYRDILYEVVDLKIKLQRIQKVLNGEE